VPSDSELKDALSGTWLGHPLHPPLTDIVVGAWTGALLLDLLGGERSEDAADTMVGIGVLAAVPTAITGLSDWAELSGGTRRVGSVHAIGTTTALLLHAVSWLSRKRGHRGRGFALSSAGFAVVSASAWLGGHLSFGTGVGVNQTAFDTLPTEWTAVAEDGDVEEGTLAAASAAGVAIVLVRNAGQIAALADRCSHRGCALHEGRLEEETIICPCHGSTFRLDGSIVKGPATSPQPALEARVESGKIEVRSAKSQG
jgi:nitrite reductase/ring-hydroxylating ferredoxin subunit/uncharacterized membrane protein